MKIGIVCPYDITKGSGVGEIVKTQARGLRRRGHEVHIITPRPAGHYALPENHIIFVGNSRDMRSPWHTTGQVSAGLNEDIEHMLATHEFDILHFHEPWVPMLSLQILTRSNAVNVATVHAKLPETVMARTMAKVIAPYTKSVLSYIDVFVAASTAGAEWVKTLTDEPVAVVPVDVDLTEFAWPEEFSDDKVDKTILYIGRLEGRKGVKYLLYAFGELQRKHKNVTLDILGDGDERVKLKVLKSDLGLKKVNFLGFRSNAEKIKRLHSADLFCAPSLFGEGFGKVLIEAMAIGLPTVAGDNPGYASVMTGLGAVSLVNPRDTPEFARRLELMLYEKNLRNPWRKWAKQEVQQYSSERMVKSYEEIFERALQKRSKQ